MGRRDKIIILPAIWGLLASAVLIFMEAGHQWYIALEILPRTAIVVTIEVFVLLTVFDKNFLFDTSDDAEEFWFHDANFP
ncbi:hypothetical protein [Thermococcus sp. GR6]|uniref:hypothetical protein n=1 Tax=Thermococcus sp. GR6 TaxID=1638256 RepID=UPI0014305F39|nr:hypothetical protein [Thermococcus sp. GR6]NJE43135.1 hypothetical protein [Thermococcus sp. GR6]